MGFIDNLTGGLLGGGGGGGLGGILGGLPIVGGLFGGGQRQPSMGGQQFPQAGGYVPPGYAPGAWPGWPVPPTSPRGAPQSGNFTGDLSKPGQAESYFGANQGAWGQPGTAQGYWNKQGQGDSNSQQYWNQVSGRGAPQQDPNRSDSAWKQFQGSTPANMSPYYDRAAYKAMQDINSSAAASGTLGNTTTMNRIGDAVSGIRAQQAKDEAGYGLQRAGLAGQLAGGADATGRGLNQDQLAWTMGLGNLAGGADQGRLGLGQLALGIDSNYLNSLNSGMNAALGAQGMLNTRGQNYFGNNLAMGNALGGATQNIYGQQIGMDMGLLDQQLQALLGYPREAMNQNANARGSSEQGIGNLFGILGSLGGAK